MSCRLTVFLVARLKATGDSITREQGQKGPKNFLENYFNQQARRGERVS